MTMGAVAVGACDAYVAAMNALMIRLSSRLLPVLHTMVRLCTRDRSNRLYNRARSDGAWYLAVAAAVRRACSLASNVLLNMLVYTSWRCIVLVSTQYMSGVSNGSIRLHTQYVAASSMLRHTVPLYTNGSSVSSHASGRRPLFAAACAWLISSMLDRYRVGSLRCSGMKGAATPNGSFCCSVMTLRSSVSTAASVARSGAISRRIASAASSGVLLHCLAAYSSIVCKRLWSLARALAAAMSLMWVTKR
ncbi:hypothetical protein ORF097L [Spotted knifejaw iridovirus]|nr:hypothetical protein ORF097L [Spotted knifejaw iridovirus]